MPNEPITPDDFTRIKNDVNGNPRYVCHFLHLDVHGWKSNLGLSERYSIACALAKTIGGRKFHNKQYGGGIVFGCVYNLPQLCSLINRIVNKTEVAA